MQRGDEIFLDTNVLIYIASGDARKAQVSESLLANGGVIGVQFLNEFVSVTRRKYGVTFAEIRQMLAQFKVLLNVVPLTSAIHERGVALAERYNFEIYDSMIVAAAQLSGCRELYSEDMHAGLTLEGLTIVNPYI
ncbi:MAG TPA: PIN domain-containing protein [Methylocystis sp.]|nr:PIN domain-containing protein [Methylocystis sp.]